MEGTAEESTRNYKIMDKTEEKHKDISGNSVSRKILNPNWSKSSKSDSKPNRLIGFSSTSHEKMNKIYESIDPEKEVQFITCSVNCKSHLKRTCKLRKRDLETSSEFPRQLQARKSEQGDAESNLNQEKPFISLKT